MKLKKRGKKRISFFMRCRLCWKISLATFLGILFFELIILIPLYTQYKQSLIADVDSTGFAIVKTLIVLNNPESHYQEFTRVGNVVSQKSILEAAVLYDSQDKVVATIGTKMIMTPAMMTNIRLTSLPLLGKHDNKFYTYWSAKKLNLPYSVVALLNSSGIDKSLITFLKQYALLIIFIAIFVTIFMMIVAGMMILSPVLSLRSGLVHATRNPEKYSSDKLIIKQSDELGDLSHIAANMLNKIRKTLLALKQQQEKLKELNETLEDKVDERTKELSRSNVALSEEINERKKAEASTRSMALFPQENPNPVLRISETGEMLFSNKASEQLLEYWKTHKKSILPEHIRMVVRDVLAIGEKKQIEENYNNTTLQLTITPIADQNYVNIYSADVTERKNYEKQLTQLINHDPVTQLPNRALFENLVNQQISNAKEQGENTLVVVIGLDNLKEINQLYTHQAGEVLLRMVAERLRKSLPQSIVIARLGGGDISLSCNALDASQRADTIASKVLTNFAKPFEVGGHEIIININIGVAVFPFDGDSSAKLIKYADLAMHHARSCATNTCQFYKEAFNEDFVRNHQLLDSVPKAIAEKQFKLYFQPQHDLANNKLIGAEVLLRWQHPKYGWLSPGEFIPLLEHSGKIIDVTEWLLLEAGNQIAHWQSMGLPEIYLAVNLSSKHFIHPTLIDHIKSILEQTAISSHLIELELTEGVAISNAEYAIHTMTQLHDLGFQLAIDDFGTEYSSLRYLQKFPVQKLKIDQAFTAALGNDVESSTIVKAIIQLAHSLDMKVIAEGIESAEHVKLLKEFQCDEGQGHYFSAPIDLATFEQYIKNCLGVTL